ncbi:hypothetical protein Tco_1414671 [Tanacetum coccineum]
MGECSPSLQSQPLIPFCASLRFIIALDSLSLGVVFEWVLSGFTGSKVCVIKHIPEGNFKRLRRQDIEDMLLLLVQVESYQKKINLSRPDLYRSDLRKMTPYTAYHDIQGIFYQDDMDRNCLMRTDEFHKFSDGTLNNVCTALSDIATGIQMEYLPKRKWSKQDKQRAWVMINAIDKKLRDRRLMRSLEKFVGERPYRGNLRLLQRTI